MLSKSLTFTSFVVGLSLSTQICNALPQSSSSSKSSSSSSASSASKATSTASLNALDVLEAALNSASSTTVASATTAVTTNKAASSSASGSASGSASASSSAASASSTATNGTGNYMSYTCTAPGITDARTDPKTRWDEVDTPDAWKDAVASAKNSISSGSTGGLSWPELISNFVHGPDQMSCEKIDARSACDGGAQCTNNPACSFMITNSLAAVSNLIYNQWDTINTAETSVSPSMGSFASTFAPQENDLDFFFKILADVLGLTFALYVSPLWNIAFKALPVFSSKEGGNLLGTIKDWVNPIVSNSVTLVKDTSLAGASINAQNSLSNNFGNMCNVWRNALATYNTNLFNGSDASVELISSIVADGHTLEGSFSIDQNTATNTLAKVMYAAMMPQAWAASTKGVHPFILDTGKPCGTKDPIDSDMLAPSTGDIAWSCYNNNLYYALAVDGETQGCVSPGGSTPYCTPNLFSIPPGLDKLDGNAWGGVTRDDVVNGAMASYAANGNKNGGSAPDPTNGDTIQSFITNGVRTPGVWNIPVCDAKTAYSNWQEASANQGKANYPCNT